MTRLCKTHLKSLAPISFSRFHNTPKENTKESPEAYEQRTWRNRMHINADGMVFIPPFAFKNCISAAAQFLGEKIKGKGQATWTKHFVSGILVMDPVDLHIKADQVQGETRFVPADGKRGGSSRVLRTFPRIDAWNGTVQWYILDDLITEEIFIRYLKQAGAFIGVGSFRVQNNGIYGRFDVSDAEWINLEAQ